MRAEIAFALCALAVSALCALAASAVPVERREGPPPEPPPPYDVVLAGGRVLDPESGLDAVVNVGIRAGQIAELALLPLTGNEVIDVTGLVVAPGFVDLHAHGQNPLSYDLMARDGVTTALDLELGAYGVEGFLRDREGQARIHYGVSAGHIPVRMKLMDGISGGHPLGGEGALGGLRRLAKGVWSATGHADDPADGKQIRTLIRLLGEQLDQGGIGIGMGLAYTPGVTPSEVRAVFELGAERRVPVFVQLPDAKQPGDMAPLQSVLEQARATGVSLHILHIVSSAGAATPAYLEAIEAARAGGLLVTTEQYPYTASSALIESALFEPGWQQRLGIDVGDLQWVATGERLTPESFAQRRREGGMLVIHGLQEAWIEQALRHPGVLIASDAMPMAKDGVHPRGAGTHARVLGRYVREQGTLTLMDALARMSLLPARRLEGYVPGMGRKGRVQVGSDADLVVFDPASVIDLATYEDPHQPSAGIPYVLVDGVVVVRDGALVEDAHPGQPLRARASAAP